MKFSPRIITRNQFILQCSSTNLQPKVSHQQLTNTLKKPCETNGGSFLKKRRQIKTIFDHIKKTFTTHSEHRTKGKSQSGKELRQQKRKSTVEGTSPARREDRTPNKKKVLPLKIDTLLWNKCIRVKHTQITARCET